MWNSAFYIAQVNMYLLLFYVFFYAVLRKETFHKSNRVYLLMAVLGSFLIPLSQLEVFKNFFVAQKIEQAHKFILVISDSWVMPQVAAETPIWKEILVWLYVCGVCVSGLVFVLKLYKTLMLIRDKDKAVAFSFFNTLYVNPKEQEQEILQYHERVHCKQWHSMDVVLCELLKIIFWCNPVIWAYQKSLKNIHEYIADDEAAAQNGDKGAYALLIVSKTLGVHPLDLTHQFFNQSLLKKRITMLHKQKSPQIAILKYGIALPLFAAMMVFSSSKIEASENLKATFKDFKIEKVWDVLHTDKVAEKLEKLQHLGSQKDTTKLVEEEKYEKNAEFLGGMPQFYKLIAANLKTPDYAVKNNISGRVTVSFVIETDGSLSDVKVLKGIGYGCDEEALRVLKLSPRWIPGMQKGKAVRQKFTLPISFSSDKTYEKTLNSTQLDEVSAVYYTDEKQNKPTDKAVLLGDVKGISIDESNHIINLDKDNAYLAIIDGVPASPSQMIHLSPDKIERMSVLKDKTAISLYGDKGKNGVVIIVTKKDNGGKNSSTVTKSHTVTTINGKTTEVSSSSDSDDAVTVTSKSESGDDWVYLEAKNVKIENSSKNSLIIVNGKEMSAKDFEKVNKDGHIKNVKIIKGDAAIEKYGDKAKNGVMEITLR